MNTQAPIDAGRLTGIAEELEQVAVQLRSDQLEDDQARELTSRCAELASQAAIELDRLARSAPEASLPGQEELL